MADRDDEERVLETVGWFLEQDIMLGFQTLSEGKVRAVMLPGSERVAAAAGVGVGRTKLEAAEDARPKFLGYDISINAPPATAVATAPPPTISITVSDSGTAEEQASVEKELERIATDYGWRVGFTDEPDGTVTGYLIDEETGEVLKSARGNDFHDAALELLADTYPPSPEGRAG